MTTTWPLLSLAIWLPILGGLVVLAAGDRRADIARWLALLVAVATFIISLPLYVHFDLSLAGMQFQERTAWVETLNIFYHLGIDGISLPLILLTTFISVLVIISAWEVIETRVSQFFGPF